MLPSIGWLVLLLFLIVLFAALLAAAVFSPALPSMILRASCSVADVKEPRYLVSFPLGYAVAAAYALLWWLFAYLLGRLDADPDAPLGAMHLCGYLLALTVGWLGTSLLYRALLAPSFTKGFWVAGLQLVLGCLAAGLTAALVMAALSVWQLLGFPMPGGAAPQRPAAAVVSPP